MPIIVVQVSQTDRYNFKILHAKSCNCLTDNCSLKRIYYYWFTLRIIAEQFVTSRNGMRPTSKILKYSSGLVYLNTKRDQLNVTKTSQNLY